MKKEDWAKAVDAYIKASGFFEKHRNIPSFQGIDKECTELINEVVKEVEARLISAVRQFYSCIRDLLDHFLIFFPLLLMGTFVKAHSCI